MAVNLSTPLDWENATGDARAMIEDLQGNILKGHGRAHTAHLFLNFGYENDREVRPILRSIGRQLPSALDQLRDAKAFRLTKLSSGRFLAFYLTAKGYDALGARAAAKKPIDAAFLEGMLPRGPGLNDPAADAFDPHFRQDGPAGVIHGMLLIAHDTDALVRTEATRWETLLSFGGIKVVGTEIGLQHFNTDGEGIENFGYVDGRSQPLLLAQDIAEEAANAGVANPHDHDSWKWSPIFPLAQALVPDAGGIHPAASFGSYFVFRKLEQDVKGFKDEEQNLAAALDLPAQGPDEDERAGAMAVGRYENGTPFVEPHVPPKLGAPTAKAVNNFDFDQDVDGDLCPFRGHIRKTNPRGDITRQFGAPFEASRNPIMPRRGITYGARDQNAALEFTDRPSGGVGLLFMAYMSDIANQFEFTQASWANNANFVGPEAGIDPVIGQGANDPEQTWWPDGYGNPKKAQFDFKLFVLTKGGEYFFAPSKSFLTTL